MIIACLVTLLCIFLPVLVYWYTIYLKFKNKFNGKLPTVPAIPIIGIAYILRNPTLLYKKLLELRKEKGRLFWAMFAFEPFLLVMDADFAEVILTSSKIIDKSKSYTYLHNWLGMGLLTSTGDKWRRHRKILTPTFHFKILEDFVPSFGNAGDVLVDILKKEVDKKSVDIYPYIAACTLDSVCESAMGTTVNAQRDTESLYVHSVKEMCRIVIDRTLSPLGQFNFTYKFTNNYKIEKESLKVLHAYTNSVIKRRKEELDNKVEKIVDVEDVGMKRRKAFLDLLVEYSREGSGMTDTDIREEVDTFMFEGHDTTASAVSFCLYLLSRNRECQDKAFAEIKQIFGEDSKREVTLKDLQDMKYLDLVLKETLRLLPSVPFYARHLTEDLMYGDILIPKGTTIAFVPTAMHLDAEYFPEPHVFKPERFLAENVTDRKRHFAYIPFSAGPRNCIGQKFAMLSMKSIISKLLKNYDFHPVDYEMILSIETVLRSRNGVRVVIKQRQWR